MKTLTSLERFVYIALSLLIFIAFLVLSKPLLVPLTFAGLFALALSPLASKLEKLGLNQLLSALFTVLGVLIIFSLAISVISYVLTDIYGELPNIQRRIVQGVEKLVEQFTAITGISMQIVQDNLWSNTSEIVNPVWGFVKKSITLSLITLGNVFLTFFYTFFLLYYRKGIMHALINNASDENQPVILSIMNSIRDTIRDYFSGIFIVMLILGVLNSFGLWVIGLDYAIFWGFVAALLVIIPYVGTTIGGILPFLYAIATLDTVWQPVAIIIMYYAVQQLEGNFITPKVIGSEIELNILTILLSMVSGGLIWGISGIILAAPVAGILQVLFSHFDETKVIGHLMSNKLYNWHERTEETTST